MDGEQGGNPIPKIVGRGKNRLKRPYSPHGYDLRSTTTRCHFNNNSQCSFCHYYKDSQDEISNYNSQLRTQLFKTTTRALVIDRLKRKKDQKVIRLRGLLQDRAAELREKDAQMLDFVRDARLRKDELQITAAQLDRSKEEIAQLNTQLEQERKRCKTLQEVNSLEKHEFTAVNGRFKDLMTQIAQLLEDLKLTKVQSDDSQISGDTQCISSRLEAMHSKVKTFDSKQSEENITEEAEVSSSRSLIYKIISDVLCGVCHEMFIDPVALPCGHAFCEFCIRMWFKRTRGCPVCRHKLVSCGQLHAVYQFRMIIDLLEKFRNPEEQNSRSEEKVRRDGLKDELYTDPAPRRFRERPTSTSDRVERFSNRRRRIDWNPSVPYHIPLPEPNLQTVRLDILPPPQPFQTARLDILPPPQPFQMSSLETPESLAIQGNAQIREPSRNVMTLLLNETFSNIDRFIRGTPSIFPLNRPSNMIENALTSQHTASMQNNIEEYSPSELIADLETLTNHTSPEVGSPLNPIMVVDHNSVEEHEGTSHTPLDSPPISEDFHYQSIISESSDEIWPNNAWQFTEESNRPQDLQEPIQDVIDLRRFEENISSSAVVLEEENDDAELQPLLEGDFLSSDSDSEFSTGTESVTESESETEAGEIEVSESLNEID